MDQCALLARIIHFELMPVDYWLNAFRRTFPEGHEPRSSLQNNLESGCSIQELLVEIALFFNKGNLRQQERRRRWLDLARDAFRQTAKPALGFALAAKAMNMPYDAFRKRFTKLPGITPSQYLATPRSDRACRMLLESAHTLTEIADRLGYSDAFHFS